MSFMVLGWGTCSKQMHASAMGRHLHKGGESSCSSGHLQETQTTAVRRPPGIHKLPQRHQALPLHGVLPACKNKPYRVPLSSHNRGQHLDMRHRCLPCQGSIQAGISEQALIKPQKLKTASFPGKPALGSQTLRLKCRTVDF